MGKHGKYHPPMPSADAAPRVQRDRCALPRHVQATAERLLAFGTWMWAPGSGCMEWSDGLYVLLGYRPGTVAPDYQIFVTAFHPEDRPRLLVQLEACLDSGAPVSFSGRLSHAGRVQRVRVAAEASRPSGRHLRCVQGAVQRAGLPEDIIAAAADAVFAFDRDTRLTLWNPAAGRLMHRTAQQVIGRRVAEAFPSLAGSRAGRCCHRVLAGQGCHARGVRIVERAAGLNGYFDVDFTPLNGPTGEVTGGIGLVREVTAQRRAQARLRLGARQSCSLVEHGPDIVMRFDRRLRCLYANRPLVPAEHAAKDIPPTTLHPDAGRSLWYRIMQRVLATGAPASVELFVPTPTGTRVFDTRMVAEPGEHGPVRSVLAVARDITEQKQAEEVIRQANRRLAATLGELRARQRQDVQTEKLTALGTLAAGIAHELNNPMMGVMNYVDYARRNLAAPETVQDVLTRAARELERIRDLLKNMLAFARPIDEPSGEFSLHSVIGAALDLMTHEFRARQIEVKLDLPFELPAVWAKEGHLQQVFVNLLMNARDALANAPRKEVSIRAIQEGTRVRVDVTDSGAGIPVAIRHRIFDPFFTTKPPGKGTGLGLSISRAIMLEQGGDLVYRDRPGGGTTLSVSIPAISSKEGESP
ncbi:MAG: PAS domain-containing protein [Hydrogenophaga sp.]